MNQIGNPTLFMIGAKQFVATEKGVMFKIMRNPRGVNKIVIELNSMDTYDMQFWYIRGASATLKSECEGIYNCNLRIAISEHTGLATRL